MMKKDRKQFIKRVLGSFTIPIIRFSYGYLLAALLSKNLTIENYGIWSLFISMIGLVMTFSSFNIMYSAQIILTGKSAENKRKDLYNILLFKTTVTLFIGLGFIVYFYKKSIFSKELMLLFFIALFFRTLCDYCYGILRALLKLKKQIKLLFIESFSVLFFLAFVIFLLKKEVRYAIVFYIIAEIISVAYGFWVLKKDIILESFDFSSIKKYLMIGLPLIPLSFMHLIVNSLSPLYIKLYIGVEQVAFYGIAQKVALLSTIPMSIVNNIYNQYLTKAKIEYKMEGVIKTFLTFFMFYFLMIIPIFSILYFFGKFIIEFVSESIYIKSYSLMILLVLSNIIISISSMMSSIFSVYNRTVVPGIIWGLSLLLYLFSVKYLIKNFELLGIAYSLLISFGLGFVLLTLAVVSYAIIRMKRKSKQVEL